MNMKKKNMLSKSMYILAYFILTAVKSKNLLIISKLL